MSKPMSPEQVAEIKARMREDPEIHRIAKLLGVTVERFLEDVERQGEAVQLHDATTPAERAGAEAEILAATQRGYATAEARRHALQGRRDVRQGAETARREGAARSLAGSAAGERRAPTTLGTGAVLAEDRQTQTQLQQQLGAARLRG